MAFFTKKESVLEKSTPTETPENSSETSVSVSEQNNVIPAAEKLKKQPIALLSLVLGGISSIGGFMFGYESGQISGISPTFPP